MTTAVDIDQPVESRSAGLASLLKGHRKSLVLLGLTSMFGGLAEAAVLTLITRVAFAVTDDSDFISIPVLGSLSPARPSSSGSRRWQRPSHSSSSPRGSRRVSAPMSSRTFAPS